jgi:nicotinamide-nucleotide amidase
VSARAGIVVTGTEVLTGRVRDSNGPWLADRLFELGIDLAHVTICGDRPEDLEAQLRFMAAEQLDVVITSGGLGPTADDLTAAIVARFSGRPLQLDEELEGRIEAIVRPLVHRFRGIDEDALRAGSRKQAMVPEGATVIEPAGTAPGLVVPPADGAGPTIVVLPGPPRELQAMWPDAVASEPFTRAAAAKTRYHQHMLRLFGIPESEIAETLRVAEAQIERLGDLEITTCLRRGEVEVVVRHEPSAAEPWDALLDLISVRHAATLFSTDGSSVDDQVAELLRGRRLALAESCTGGLVAARLTDRPGASEYLAGAVVSYSNEAKSDLLGVDPALIERHGAVSPETAEAMAAGAIERFQADTAVAVTGVAGPGGGTPAKPVGTVCFCVRIEGRGSVVRTVQLPGDRAAIRDRSTTVALHLLRRVLRGDAT